MTLDFDKVQEETDPFNQYQQWALTKMGGPVLTMPNGELLLGAIGVAGEGGEYADTVKKIVFHSHELTGETRLKMALELGDLLWYLAIAANSIGFSLAYIADKNMEKLNRRYPDTFSEARSQDPNRDDPQPPIVTAVGTVAQQMKDNKRTEGAAAAINDAILVDYQAKIESLYTTGEISTSRVPTTDELAIALESATNSTTVER